MCLMYPIDFYAATRLSKYYLQENIVKLDIMLLSEISSIQKHKYLSFFYMQNLDLKVIEYKICI